MLNGQTGIEPVNATPATHLRPVILRGAAPGPHLLIVAGVHGDEFEPMLAVRQLQSQIDPSELCGTLTLVPLANRSAFENGTRTGIDGLDMARVCPGDPAGSPTMQAAAELAKLIRSADSLIDLHTGGHKLTLMPLAGYMLHANAEVLDTQRRMAKAFNLPLVWGTSPSLQGRTLSVARDAGVPAIYVEHGGGSYCEARVRDLIDGCLNVMAELRLLRSAAPVSNVRYVVEDDRVGSGHLQVNCPAPIDGLFRTTHQPGDLVKSGELLGTIIDFIEDRLVNVTATQSGILAVLRTWAAVKAGDSLATIIPLPAATEPA